MMGGALAFALLCALVFADVRVQAAGERFDVAVVPVEGNAEVYKVFHSQLREWVQAITAEIPRTTEDTHYLDQIRLFDRPNAFDARASMMRYWKTSDALEILEAHISPSPKSPGQYELSSQIYLGELNGKLPTSSIVIVEPYSVLDYADTKDSHMAVLFYVLAMDARRVGPLRHALIAPFLGAAKGKLSDIKRRRGKLSDDLINLESAIGSAEKDLVAGR
jgi:hypothetical protein